MRILAFEPLATAKITVGASTARVAVTTLKGKVQVRVCSDGTDTVWIKFGGSTVTAATTDMPILPGSAEIFTIASDGDLYVAAIGNSASGTIYFTPGSGI